MKFRTSFTATYRWSSTDRNGLEHLWIEANGNAVKVRSVLAGNRGGIPYGISYKIICDSKWRVRNFKVLSVDGRLLHLMSDGEGNWSDTTGKQLARFQGAIDIDLAGTPFTNTLPVRRLAKHEPQARQQFKMLYVPFDTLAPRLDDQAYTCIQPFELYRYEAIDRAFEADLPVDENGIVFDYPTLFTRKPLAG
ncbi:putative glycolipid-binding domain-containing protein [Roseibium sp. RKSG952]|uniref:putative glycolipid-binding domain-containing protein n=1 Tax=Roseibium sp. RKSG952 TaxID=2529384 RepID=UPI0012BD656A|nr:putative glycolipid-binding domain-containing protein [Roseibium sp. RKSG952]MTH98038.1 transcriptional regulator [Roseibium sp. RKSG952]